jgi:PAS domain-containing protein
MLATEQGAPGCGKIGNTPDGYVSRDGAGAVDWNKYFYALCGWDQYMRIRVEAWEDDDVDSDDQYPVWQWYWAPGTWQSSYANKGWFTSGSRIDLGACRYTVQFKIETVY